MTNIRIIGGPLDGQEWQTRTAWPAYLTAEGKPMRAALGDRLFKPFPGSKPPRRNISHRNGYELIRIEGEKVYWWREV